MTMSRTATPEDASPALRVGFYQFCPEFGRPDENTERIVQALETVRADVLVLPELALSGYHFQDAREALSLADDPGDSSRFSRLQALCRRLDLYLVFGFAERAGTRCFNSAALMGPEGVRHVYRKLHLFDREKEVFTPGDRPLQVQSISKGVRLGMMICFDWVFPEVARSLSLQGATLLCHPCNLVLDHCQRAMQTRCLENRVYAVTANRFGMDSRPHGTLRFTGQSQIVGPDGTLVYRAATDDEVLHLAELHTARAEDKMLTANNHLLTDRRPAFYQALAIDQDSGDTKRGRGTLS